ncbi:hypothetical protein O181_031436 [Austropuccinia psidii MF-1]|uniref:Integrase catalytic domain-containing protein n=1 Tax=Austropuccinia psidii MF-1 TaxID=1389203 RepID=A0A9Q3D0H0_9BASI|nr:hypothetical protein [Austropuccinia psidii MF-1]
MIKIQEPSEPLEIVHIDWVTSLPPGADSSYNSCLVIVDRFGRTPIFLPFEKDHTALLISYHPQTDGIAERMIQTLEDMVRGFCAYGLELKYCDEIYQDWFNLLPALELPFKKSVNSRTNKTPAILEKQWNHRLPQDFLRNNFVKIRPKADIFKKTLEKARKNAVKCMEE